MAIGAFAVRHNVSGSGNLGIGYGALVNNTTGYRNTGIGDNCLVNLNITADDPSVGFNTAIGAYAGGGITTGVNNTIIGANVAGLAAALSNNIILAIGDGTIKAQYASSNWTLAGCSLTTGAPAGGTGGKWKLGIYVATPTVPTGYIQVDVGGTLYEIPAKVH